MYKNNLVVLIFVSMTGSLFSVGGALERYTIPQQMPMIQKAHIPPIQIEKRNEDSESKQFRKKARKLSQEEREELKVYYEKRIKRAIEKKRFNEAAYYQGLIDILNAIKARES